MIRPTHTFRLSVFAAVSTAMSMAFTPVAAAMPSFEFVAATQPESGPVVIFVGADRVLSGQAAVIDAEADGRLSSALEAADFSGAFGATLSVLNIGPYANVKVIGRGDEALGEVGLVELGGYAAMAADDEEGLSILVDTFEANAAAYIAKGYALGDYTYDRYKSDAEGTDGAVTLVGAGNGSRDLFESDLVHLVAGVSLARNLGNAPGNAIYPETFIDTVRTAFRGTGNVSFRVLNPRDMERRGMGALLGVGQGSVREPRLLVITYSGGPRDAAPLALVGKGVTFDTGGISLKESDTMWRMKADLSGAAAVAGAVLAAAKRRAPLNLVGVMPLAENMPGANAIRPGDVLTTSSGKTIEILNTDAEGRLILADAITYTQTEFDPYMLLNIATLTGSAARATGDEYGAVMTRDFALSTEMMDIGKAAGEPVWPLPLHPNHFDQIVSDVADIKNLGGSPGASTAAALVGSFVDEDRPWVHLDMAGVFFADGSVPGYPKGNAGWGVRFMDTLVRRESE